MPRTNTLPILFVLRIASFGALCTLMVLEPASALAQERDEDTDLSQEEAESEKQDSEEDEGSKDKDSKEKDEESKGDDSKEKSDEGSKEKSSKGDKSVPELIPEPEDSDAPPLPEPEEGSVNSCRLRGNTPSSPLLSLGLLLMLWPLKRRNFEGI